MHLDPNKWINMVVEDLLPALDMKAMGGMLNVEEERALGATRAVLTLQVRVAPRVTSAERTLKLTTFYYIGWNR